MHRRPVDLVVSGEGFEKDRRRRATRHGPYEPAGVRSRRRLGLRPTPRHHRRHLGGGGATDRIAEAISVFWPVRPPGRREAQSGPNCRAGSRGAVFWSRGRPRRCATPPRPNPVGRTVEDRRRVRRHEALVGVGSVAAERFAVVDGEIDALGTEAVAGHLGLHRHGDDVVGLHSETDDVRGGLPSGAKRSCGVWRSSMTASVTVSSMPLPARMKRALRPNASCRFRAGRPRAPCQRWGRRRACRGSRRSGLGRRSSGVSAGMALMTLTISSRNASGSLETGGSMASRPTIWRRWFWMTSRMAPTPS